MGKTLAALCLLLVALPAGNASPQERPRLTVAYLANEGVFVESGGVSILMDGLHRAGVAGYEAIPPETLAKLEGAQPPYDRVSLILTTHRHADHFDAGSVAAHLSRNTNAIFVGGQETADAVVAAFDGAALIRSRVHAVTPEMGRSTETQVGAIRIRVLRLAHGRTQNVGFLVEMNGWKVLHLGDSDGTIANFAPFLLASQKIDVAFIPYWYALGEESRRVVREQIGARNVVFFHIPKENPETEGMKSHMERYGGRAGMVKQMSGEFPRAIFFTDPLQRSEFD